MDTVFILFDFSYFTLVVLILLAIVTGVIIDTFGELRDQASQKAERLKSQCFMCGLGEGVFSNFDLHVDEEHNLWSYAAYIVYLQELPVVRQTRLEQYVHGKIITGDSSWLPNNQAAVISMSSETEDATNHDVLERIGNLEETMSYLLAEVKLGQGAQQS